MIDNIPTWLDRPELAKIGAQIGDMHPKSPT